MLLPPLDPMTAEEEADLVTKAKTGDVPAAQRLVRAHLRFLYKTAIHFKRRTFRLEVDDLVSYGVIGIYKAIEKYEFGKGTRFLSYASYWINQKMGVAMRSTFGALDAVSAPSRVEEFVGTGKFAREHARIMKEVGDDPNAIEAAFRAQHDIKREQFRAIVRNLMQPALSTNLVSRGAGVAFGTPIELGDLIPSGHRPTDDAIADQEIEARIRSAVARVRADLAPRMVAILDQRLLATDDNERTLVAIGDDFGICRERVRQLEALLIGQLKEALHVEWEEFKGRGRMEKLVKRRRQG